MAALLEPGDEWSSTFGTGATCYSDQDTDGTPFRLECHFESWPTLDAPRLPPAMTYSPSPSAPVAPSICDNLQTTLGGTCSPSGSTGTSFVLINMHEGLSYGGLKFGDENWGAGENSPRNLCLLAAYGGTMPSELVLPTTDSYGSCCALERSTQGSYWFESCSIGDGLSNAHGSRDADGNYRPGETLCVSTPERKQCTNYAMLEPGDAWSTQIGTGASCYSRNDGDGTPYRLECHFPQVPRLYPPPPPEPSPPPPDPQQPGASAFVIPGSTSGGQGGARQIKPAATVGRGGMDGGGVFCLVLFFGLCFAVCGYWIGRPEKAKAFATAVKDQSMKLASKGASARARTVHVTAPMASHDASRSVTPYQAPTV